MIHLKLICDTRRAKKDGSYPLVFRLSLNRKRKNIPSGHSCQLKEWDERLGTVKTKTSKMKLLAERLQERELSILNKIKEFEQKFPTNADLNKLRDYLLGKEHNDMPKNVLMFWNLEVKRLRSSKHYGNARSNQSSLGSINKYKSLDVTFAEINYNWLVDLETKMKSNNVKVTSISVYMRALRAIYNKAINHGVANSNDYPFKRYKIVRGSSSPRVLNMRELRSYFQYKPEMDSLDFDAWNYGMLIFMLRGINFRDLSLLTRDNLKGDRVVYTRSKTGKVYSVKLLPFAQEIFNYYMKHDRITLLPILSNEEFENKSIHPVRISQCRKTSNKWMSRIGKRIGVRELITSYVFRYSHANICKELGYSKDLISESLGHAYGLAVSAVYMEDYDIELIDEMNEHVVNTIIRGC